MKTLLYDQHRALGAKIVEFAGWEMPVFYKGVVAEHLAVRNGVGIFDVSHMGRIAVEGNQAEPFLDYLSTKQIAGKPNLSATYTVWANALGTCVDDVIVYKQDAGHFFVIVNASNRQKDLEHLNKYAQGFDVHIRAMFDEGILAVQGPKAVTVVARLIPEAIHVSRTHFLPIEYKGNSVILAGTGYTGAGGCELYGSALVIEELWKELLDAGRDQGIQPAGLGARDTLRLEKGYALYGHELSESIFVSETVSKWAIDWKKKDFLGKTKLQELEGSPAKRSEYGIVLLDGGIAREGFQVYQNEKLIGKVTSGTFSPSLNKAIAIILVEGQLQAGEQVEVQIRQNRAAAKVAALPFIPN
jgi:aminomethyltransferase